MNNNNNNSLYEITILLTNKLVKTFHEQENDDQGRSNWSNFKV